MTLMTLIFTDFYSSFERFPPLMGEGYYGDVLISVDQSNQPNQCSILRLGSLA
jgi:hypothetical protein